MLTLSKDDSSFGGFFKNNVLFLDEPDLSLSLYWQEMLIPDIEKYCKNKIVFIATQSPHMLNEDQIKYIVEVEEK